MSHLTRWPPDQPSFLTSSSPHPPPRVLQIRPPATSCAASPLPPPQAPSSPLLTCACCGRLCLPDPSPLPEGSSHTEVEADSALTGPPFWPPASPPHPVLLCGLRFPLSAPACWFPDIARAGSYFGPLLMPTFCLVHLSNLLRSNSSSSPIPGPPPSIELTSALTGPPRERPTLWLCSGIRSPFLSWSFCSPPSTPSLISRETLALPYLNPLPRAAPCGLPNGVRSFPGVRALPASWPPPGPASVRSSDELPSSVILGGVPAALPGALFLLICLAASLHLTFQVPPLSFGELPLL